MGQARDDMGDVPLPHEVMGGDPGSFGRMAGSVFSEEPSGLDKQKSGGYGTGAISKEPRAKYLQKATGAQSF